MRRFWLFVAVALCLPLAAHAQTGTATGMSVTPTGAPTSLTIAAIAAQQGVLLDSFKVGGDADDTASLTRAVAAGVPVLLGPKTYNINNFSMAGTPASFVLRGVPGQSVIQRTSASGSQFFAISATYVVIDGVTFDMNKAAVTANQWGVFLNKGGQSVNVRNSVFENNSGSLGVGLAILATAANDGGTYNISDNEIANNTAPIGGGLYLATASHGVVSRNYVHDNGGVGIFASSNGAATATNYLTDLLISLNRVERNGNDGVNVGGFAPPYSYTTPPATHVSVDSNLLVDNALYGIQFGGDHLSVVSNRVFQSAPAVVVFGGIDGNGTNTNVFDNDVIILGNNWGIDVGGSLYSNVKNNTVTMSQGTAINIGSNLNSSALGNHLILSGTAQGVVVQAIDQGGGATFPTPASGISIEANTIDITGNAATGIKLLDDAGGYPGATPILVRRNIFNVTGSGSNPGQDILWYGSASSAVIDGNIHNGVYKVFVDQNGGGDIVVPLVYLGGQASNVSATTNVRSIITPDISNFGGQTSVLYVIPSAGGSGYTGATVIVFSGTGCTGQAAAAEIISGVIIGVKMSNFGSGCSGTVTVSATDSGGGTGATFTVGTLPHIPTGSTLNFIGNSNFLLQRNGGFVTLNQPRAIPMTNQSTVQLVALSSNTWNVLAASIGTFTTANLPTCNATAANAWAYASDATTPTYGSTLAGGGTVLTPVVCNSTNWITH